MAIPGLAGEQTVFRAVFSAARGNSLSRTDADRYDEAVLAPGRPLPFSPGTPGGAAERRLGREDSMDSEG